MDYNGKALTVAGSDSGGRAGIQVDLEKPTSFSAYRMSVVTSVIAQNTTVVRAICDMPPEIIGEQIEAVMEDIALYTAKTGILSNNTTVQVVAQPARTTLLKPGLDQQSNSPAMSNESNTAKTED